MDDAGNTVTCAVHASAKEVQASASANAEQLASHVTDVTIQQTQYLVGAMEVTNQAKDEAHIRQLERQREIQLLRIEEKKNTTATAVKIEELTLKHIEEDLLEKHTQRRVLPAGIPVQQVQQAAASAPVPIAVNPGVSFVGSDPVILPADAAHQRDVHATVIADVIADEQEDEGAIPREESDMEVVTKGMEVHLPPVQHAPAHPASQVIEVGTSTSNLPSLLPVLNTHSATPSTTTDATINTGAMQSSAQLPTTTSAGAGPTITAQTAVLQESAAALKPGTVIALSNLDTRRLDCDKLFSLLSHFLNPHTIQLRDGNSECGGALVQCGFPEEADTAAALLDGMELFGRKIACEKSELRSIHVPQIDTAEDRLVKAFARWVAAQTDRRVRTTELAIYYRNCPALKEWKASTG